jgi:hypothetical protein
MNKLKQGDEIEKTKKSVKASKSLSGFFSGKFISQERAISSVPYVFFLTLLGIMYIANGYNAEQIVRDLDSVGDELKEMRSEYITIKSDLNFNSKQSQVAQATFDLGIKSSTTPPSKIVVDEKEMEKINTAN